MTDEYGQNVLDRSTVLTGTWEYGGEKYKLKVNDISGKDFQLIQEYAQLGARLESDEQIDESEVEDLADKAENLDDFSWESKDSDTGFIQSVIDEKLITPDPDVEATGMSKLRALFRGMMETWRESDEVANAKAEMPLDEGNGQQSRVERRQH